MVNFDSTCSANSLAWGNDAPGMGLFICQPDGTTSARPVTAVAAGSPAAVTVVGHGYKSGQIVRIAGTGLSGVDNRTWRITVLTPDKFALDGSTGTGTYTGSGTATRKDGWIQIRHTAGSKLPASCNPDDWHFKTDAQPNSAGVYWCTTPGTWTNVRPINALTASTYAAIQFDENAGRYRFVGLEVTHRPVPNPPPAHWSTSPFKQGNVGSLLATTETNDNIIFDRCDIHGLDYPARLGTAMYLNGSNIAVINSRIHKVNRWTETAQTGNESMAISITEGPGPGHIENNFIEAIGISVFFTGSTYHVPPPADYVIKRNYFSHPDTYLYGSPLNVSRKNYPNRHHLEVKSGKRLLIEGNTFDNNWADVNQGSFIMLSPRAGALPAAKKITNILNGTVTLSPSTYPYSPGMYVNITGTGAANHDGIRKIDTMANANTFTVVPRPSGTGVTGSVTAVASDVQIADIDIKNNIFRNGPNVLWMLGHDNFDSSTEVNTKGLQHVRFVNNLVYGMDARAYTQGGRVSPIGMSPNGRSGIVVYLAFGVESLIVQNNTIYDFKGLRPTFLSFDTTTRGANGGLDVRNNIFTATPPVITTSPGPINGTAALNIQWTAHPNPAWILNNNVFCCGVTATTKNANPPRNSWADTNAAIGFTNPYGGDFTLVPSSPYKAGASCYGISGDCTSDGRDAGVNMQTLMNAVK
jgi:hypothetical protein